MGTQAQWGPWEPSWYDYIWFVPLLVFVLLPISALLNLYEWLRWRLR